MASLHRCAFETTSPPRIAAGASGRYYFAMTRRSLSVLVALAVFATSCLHTRSRELVELDLDRRETAGLRPLLRSAEAEGLAVSHLIYTPGKLPLEDFFRRLSQGELRESLGAINAGGPGNTRNEILRELLEAGLVPVYVRIRNEGPRARAFSERDFFLAAGPAGGRAIAAADVPREFERFHPEAFAANVLNVTTAVVIIAGVIVLLAAACSGSSCSGLHDFPFGSGGGGHGGSSGGGSEGSMLNETTLTRQFGYRDYLLQPTMLEPGATAEGLIFFRMNPQDADRYELRFDPAMYRPLQAL